MEDKRTFTRQMYTGDSEVGKMKLQSVKENLYEATTKAVLYSIEMYTKKELSEWVRTGLIERLDKANKDLNREKEELEQGHIGMFDITNGCSVINDFVRKDALAIARNELQAKIEVLNNKKGILEEEKCILEERKKVLENNDDIEENLAEDDEEMSYFFDENDDGEYSLPGEEENTELEREDEIDDFDEDDDDVSEDVLEPSEIDLFSKRMCSIRDLEEISNIEDELKEGKKHIDSLISDLNTLKKGGQDILTRQDTEERESLENLRTLRNIVFAHRTEDMQEISFVGSWEPEAGPLYQWASEILKYIKVIESRYKYYGWFDDYYASREGKDKFDSCKVYIQRQIKELYVNRSSITFEFAGELYDKDDEEYNFKKLIENMAISWDTGIRYLTVVTNEDLPEMNVFFKECLSGTNKYVDSYLVDRNALRASVNNKNSDNTDYAYFKLLYHLNPSMDNIYWRDKVFSQKDFAIQILYKLVKVKNMFQFDARLKDYEKFYEGIDVRCWCEQHLLSDVYFAGLDDQIGKKYAEEMENNIIEFCRHSDNKGRMHLYRKAIRSSVQLYFYMRDEIVFSYTRSNGQNIHWRSLDMARQYLEHGVNFKSYSELCGFVDELYKSDYFKIWRKQLKAHDRKKMEEV